MFLFKKDYRRNLPLERRDLYGFDAADRVQLKQLLHASRSLIIGAKLLRKRAKLSPRKKTVIKSVYRALFAHAYRVCAVRNTTRSKSKIYPRKSFSDFDSSNFSSKFRFRSVEDLGRLLMGFRLPDVIHVRTWKYSSEEVLLISLMRLSFPNRWTDVQVHFPGRSRQELQGAFYWFLDFMIVNWGYLLLNNREYWLPHFANSAEAIRIKLSRLPNEQNRQFYDTAESPCGFSVFGFIDNTMFAMCRPGGGPAAGGQCAPRVDRLVQQAWWTGWKKLHGLKWQTVILANGMDFEVWGPVSVRHNDNYTLNRSRITEKLAALQINERYKYKIYGDSAYLKNELKSVVFSSCVLKRKKAFSLPNPTNM